MATFTTFEELQAKVLRAFKRTDKQTELEEAINEAYLEMVACIDPRKQKDQIYKTLVAGREEYPIPDTILRINHPIRLIEGTTNNASTSHPLVFLTKEEYDRNEPNPNAVTIVGGRPWGYCIWKNSILLTDIPDSVSRKIEINIGGEATKMSALSDATIFTPTWDETIKAGALARLYAGIERTDLAGEWQKVYRYGFAGNESYITGGLELLKKLQDQVDKAPNIVVNNDF